MFYALYYFFVDSKTSQLFLFINNFTLIILVRGRSNSCNRIGLIFSQSFKRNLVTLFFFTSSTSASNSRERLSRLERKSRRDKNKGQPRYSRLRRKSTSSITSTSSRRRRSFSKHSSSWNFKIRVRYQQYSQCSRQQRKKNTCSREYLVADVEIAEGACLQRMLVINTGRKSKRILQKFNPRQQ